MSMRSMADYAWEIPEEKLEELIPGIIGEIESLDEQEFEDYVMLDDAEPDEPFSEDVLKVVEKVKEFGKSHGLELSFGWRYLQDGDDADTFKPWYVYCGNAYTINPAFKALGGFLNSWVVYG